MPTCRRAGYSSGNHDSALAEDIAVRVNSVLSLVCAAVSVVLVTAAICAISNSAVRGADNSRTPASGEQAAGKTWIKIGFVGTLSGRLADEGAAEMENGIRLWLEENNYQIAGRKVDLIVEDDGNSITDCIEKVHKLVERDHVDVLAGFLRPGFLAAETFEKYRTPVVLAICADDDLTQRKRSAWMIRTSISSSQTMYPLGEWAYKARGLRRVAIIGPDLMLAYQVAGGFQTAFEKLGGKVVQKIWTPATSADFLPYINALRKDVDAVVVCNGTGSNKTFDRQIKSVLPNMPLIGFGPYCDEPVLRDVGALMQGSVFSYPYVYTLANSANRKFVDEYVKKYGHPPGFFPQCTYVCGLWMQKAIEAVNGNVENKEKFRDALRNVRLPDSPRGPMKLDAFGNPIENMYICRVEKTKGGAAGSVIQVYQNVSQFWHSSAEDYLKMPPFNRSYPPCNYCSETTRH